MELVRDSAEHYFLNILENMKNKPTDCYGLYFSMSKALNHQDLVSDLSQLSKKIEVARTKTDVFADELHAALQDAFDGGISVFKDLDIFAYVHVKDKMAKKHLEEIYKTMAGKLSKGMSDMDSFAGQFRSYQKIADEKLLSARRLDGYEIMADAHKISCIPALRKRRDEPLVMVVEDDRFTAHYASSILSNDFDLVICKDGEDAVQSYIQNAPDIVFLDIHLPGLNGHEVLQSIHAVDPEAFIVMLSVDSMKENIKKAEKMGAHNFIKKPFTKERLVEAVKASPYVKALTRTDTTDSEHLFH